MDNDINMLSWFFDKPKNQFNFVFKNNNSLESRCLLSKRIKEKYLDKLAIIIESTSLDLKKTKFLVSREIYYGDLLSDVRKHIHNLKSDGVIYIFTSDKIIPPLTESLLEIYQKNKDPEDGLLYLWINDETLSSEYI